MVEVDSPAISGDLEQSEENFQANVVAKELRDYSDLENYFVEYPMVGSRLIDLLNE